MSLPVVGSKTIDDLPPFTEAEMKELFTGFNHLLGEGHPDVPIAMPFFQLARITATLKKYRDLAAKIPDCFAGLEAPGVEEMFERVEALQEEASGLLNAEPPPPPSRIIRPNGPLPGKF
jgi:hypothetical protein